MAPMDDSPYEDEVQEIPATQWHWTFPVIRVLTLGANLSNAFRAFFVEVAADVGSHANYQIERDQFAAEAGRELEALLEGSDDDGA